MVLEHSRALNSIFSHQKRSVASYPASYRIVVVAPAEHLGARRATHGRVDIVMLRKSKKKKKAVKPRMHCIARTDVERRALQGQELMQVLQRLHTAQLNVLIVRQDQHYIWLVPVHGVREPSARSSFVHSCLVGCLFLLFHFYFYFAIFSLSLSLSLCLCLSVSLSSVFSRANPSGGCTGGMGGGGGGGGGGRMPETAPSLGCGLRSEELVMEQLRALWWPGWWYVQATHCAPRGKERMEN